MNPRNTDQRERLFKAVRHGYRQDEWARNLVRNLVEEYAGSGYGPAEGNKREILANITNQAVDAYTMALVANRPYVTATARRVSNWFFAQKFQTALNNLMKEINLEQTLYRAVLDAFFCVGIVKIHLADSVPVEMEDGTYMDPGSPYASNVTLQNFVYDHGVSVYDKCRFVGDMYRIPFDYLKDDAYDQKIVRQLRPSVRGPADGTRLEDIGRVERTEDDDVIDMVDVADLWDREEGMIFTFYVKDVDAFTLDHAPIAEMPWTGSEHGPYPLLGFGDVPGSVMPLSHAAQLAGMARVVNSIMRKQKRGANSQKTIHTFSPQAADDAQKVQKAGHDGWVCVTEPSEFNEVHIGGVDAGLEAMRVGWLNLIDRMGGNLTAILGLGAQADTVGQEEIIHKASSRKVAQMQNRVASFTRHIIRDLGQMLWDDVAKTIPGEMTLEGLEDFPIDATWGPTEREGRFIDYELDIDVDSMPYRSSRERLSEMINVMNQVYNPMAQQLAAQGGEIDFHELTEMVADLLNEPRWKRLVRFAGKPAESGDEAGSPSKTQHESVRRSVPTQGSPQGQAHVEQQQWMNMAQQQGA